MTQRAPHACYPETTRLIVTQAERNRNRRFRREEREAIATMIRNDGRRAQRRAQRRIYLSQLGERMHRIERAAKRVAAALRSMAKRGVIVSKSIKELAR